MFGKIIELESKLLLKKKKMYGFTYLATGMKWITHSLDSKTL